MAGNPWCSLGCECITPVSPPSSRGALSPCVLSSCSHLLIRARHVGLGPHPTPVWPHVNKSHQQPPHFQIKSFSEVPGVGTWTYLFRDPIQPITTCLWCRLVSLKESGMCMSGSPIRREDDEKFHFKDYTYAFNLVFPRLSIINVVNGSNWIKYGKLWTEGFWLKLKGG